MDQPRSNSGFGILLIVWWCRNPSVFLVGPAHDLVLDDLDLQDLDLQDLDLHDLNLNGLPTADWLWCGHVTSCLSIDCHCPVAVVRRRAGCAGA